MPLFSETLAQAGFLASKGMENDAGQQEKQGGVMRDRWPAPHAGARQAWSRRVRFSQLHLQEPR
jgi:hypothetical protein